MQRAVYATETTVAFGVSLLYSVHAIITVLNESDISTVVPGMIVVAQNQTVHTVIWLISLLVLLFALGILYVFVYVECQRECTASKRPVSCQSQRNNLRFVAFLLLGISASAILAALALASVIASRYFLLVLGSLSSPFTVLYFSSTVSYAPLPRLPP